MKAVIIGANSYIARNMIALNQQKQYAELQLFDYASTHIDGAENYHTLHVLSQDEMSEAVKDCDLVYFFVGKTGTIQGFDEPDVFLDINERALLRLLNACRSQDTKAKVIFPSTRLVYRGTDKPIKEDGEKEFKTPYAMQKYACEQYLSMYHVVYGVDYCILRLCVPYGTLVEPVSSYGTLDFFIRQAHEEGRISIYRNGSQKRTFTYICDLCEVLWQAGLSENCINDIYNVPGEELSIAEVAAKVARLYDVDITYTEWPAMAAKIESGDTVFDAAKLTTALGFECKMKMDHWLEAQR